MPRIVSLFIWRRQKKMKFGISGDLSESIHHRRCRRHCPISSSCCAFKSSLWYSLRMCSNIEIGKKNVQSDAAACEQWVRNYCIRFHLSRHWLLYDFLDITPWQWAYKEESRASGSYQWIICETLHNNNNKSSINCDDERSIRKSQKHCT